MEELWSTPHLPSWASARVNIGAVGWHQVIISPPRRAPLSRFQFVSGPTVDSTLPTTSSRHLINYPYPCNPAKMFGSSFICVTSGYSLSILSPCKSNAGIFYSIKSRSLFVIYMVRSASSHKFRPTITSNNFKNKFIAKHTSSSLLKIKQKLK